MRSVVVFFYVCETGETKIMILVCRTSSHTIPGFPTGNLVVNLLYGKDYCKLRRKSSKIKIAWTMDFQYRGVDFLRPFLNNPPRFKSRKLSNFLNNQRSSCCAGHFANTPSLVHPVKMYQSLRQMRAKCFRVGGSQLETKDRDEVINLVQSDLEVVKYTNCFFLLLDFFSQ